jgi:hypothetical protein
MKIAKKIVNCRSGEDDIVSCSVAINSRYYKYIKKEIRLSRRFVTIIGNGKEKFIIWKCFPYYNQFGQRLV